MDAGPAVIEQSPIHDKDSEIDVNGNAMTCKLAISGATASLLQESARRCHANADQQKSDKMNP